jgi:tetratricopeptide (TPR) repeat protein
LANAIFSEPEPVDVRELNDRIASLKANPKHDDPAWWNDLAGGYLRLGQATEAVQLLEPVTNRFANDYGIHANLGTAYHLLGRYKEAAGEIGRDLELNPEGHAGLEKYHLALLQYLSRDADYQLCHLYVDEFTEPFLLGRGRYVNAGFPRQAENTLSDDELNKALVDIKKMLAAPSVDQARDNLPSLIAKVAASQPPPPYMENESMDLGRDSKLEEGVAYMAKLNRKEPACFVMAGVVANKGRNRNLAKAAFKKAIELGSPQRVVLESQIAVLNTFHPSPAPYIIGGLIGSLIVYCGVRIWQDVRKRRAVL